VKKPVQVSLLGQTFTLKSEMDRAHVERVASLINAKVEELRGKGGIVQTNTLLLMAAMNIADDFIRSVEREDSLRIELNRRVAKLDELVEGYARNLESTSESARREPVAVSPVPDGTDSPVSPISTVQPIAGPVRIDTVAVAG
jgi:cell division protein ZapA